MDAESPHLLVRTIDCTKADDEDHDITLLAGRSRQCSSTAQPPLEQPLAAASELPGPSAVYPDLTLIAQLTLPLMEQTVKHTVLPPF